MTLSNLDSLVQKARAPWNEKLHPRDPHTGRWVDNPLASVSLSSVLNVKLSKREKPSFEEALAAVERVHSFPADTRSVTVKTRRNLAGFTPWGPELIATPGFKPETYFHEFGHMLDWALAGSPHSHRSASESEDRASPLYRVMAEINASEGTQNLLDDLEWEKQVEDPNKRRTAYQLRTHEKFARAYAQYIAVKNGYEIGRGLAGSGNPWGPDDFIYIQEAFDDMFAELGLSVVQKAGFDPSQKRDPTGRWSANGGGGKKKKKWKKKKGGWERPLSAPEKEAMARAFYDKMWAKVAPYLGAGGQPPPGMIFAPLPPGVLGQVFMDENGIRQVQLSPSLIKGMIKRLKKGQPFREQTWTLAHEWRHVFQNANLFYEGREAPHDEQGIEEDANAFANRVMRAIGKNRARRRKKKKQIAPKVIHPAPISENLGASAGTIPYPMVEKAGFDPSQKRDPTGRWSANGGKKEKRPNKKNTKWRTVTLPPSKGYKDWKSPEEFGFMADVRIKVRVGKKWLPATVYTLPSGTWLVFQGHGVEAAVSAWLPWKPGDKNPKLRDYVRQPIRMTYKSKKSFQIRYRVTKKAVGGGAVPSVAKAAWNEQLHPRDQIGRFRDVVGIPDVPEILDRWTSKFPSEGGFYNVSTKRFAEAFRQARKDDPDIRDYTSDFSDEELGKIDLYMTPDGKTGGGLRGDEIVGLFNNGGKPGAGGKLVRELIAKGGRRLDCLGEGLRDYYAQFGFKVVKVDQWNDKYAPPHWNTKTRGRPNVYYMQI